MTGHVEPLVVFVLDAQRYGLRVAAVERVAALVHITPLPGAPSVVLGVIDVHGEIVTVFDVRARFRLSAHPATSGQRLLIARTARRAVALLADDVLGVLQVNRTDIVDQPAATLPFVDGVVRCADGLLLLHDLEHFLSAAEQRTLDDALAAH